MRFPIWNTHWEQTACLWLAGLMLALMPLWLMLAIANPSANAQTSDDVSRPSADWTEFLRDNMQRWNPYETVLGKVTVGSLALKWKTTIGMGGGGLGAVVNGVVYFGAGDGNVYALNASTGAKLWSFTTTTGSGVGAPAVEIGRAHV